MTTPPTDRILAGYIADRLPPEHEGPRVLLASMAEGLIDADDVERLWHHDPREVAR